MEKKYRHLNQLDRDQIALFRSQGLSFSAIGVMIERSGSTISREYNRNRNEAGDYLPSEAHADSKLRKKEASERVSKCDAYEHRIYARLCQGWTPAQISGRLSKDEPGFSVSHESIYSYIYDYQYSWAELLPRKHWPRWFKGMGKSKTKRDMIPNRVSILDRPQWINDQSKFGHWAGDSIVCSQSTVSLNVTVERQTQYVNIRRVENRGAEATQHALVDALGNFKKQGRCSLTLDNGIEFKYPEKVKESLGIETYFCQPYHSWEKGLVEQVNGLIRRFIPKKTDLSKITEKEISVIAFLLNSRPRKLLNWETPAEVFARKCGMKLVNDALAT